MNQTWENGKKPSFGMILTQIGPLKKIFISFTSTRCCKLSLYAIARKTNEQNLRKWWRTKFGPDFGLFGPNLGRKKKFVGFTFTIYWTLLKAIIVCNFMENQWTKLEKMTKNLILAWFWSKFGHSKIFSTVLPLLGTIACNCWEK